MTSVLRSAFLAVWLLLQLAPLPTTGTVERIVDGDTLVLARIGAVQFRVLGSAFCASRLGDSRLQPYAWAV